MTHLFTQKSLDVTNYQQLSYADIINIQTNILARWQNAKELENEIQHQHNFLQDFFGQILGYTAQTGNPHNTLCWESGTNDGRRPDGILGFDLQSYQNQDINQQNISAGDIRVVIELKGSNVDLDKNQNRKSLAITPIEQGFLYAPKVGGKCEWVIVSNFVEIRLYKTNDSTKYHSFFVADLAKDANKLKEFHFLLAFGRLFIKQENQSPTNLLNTEKSGAEIEKLFYAHYSALRHEIWQNLLQLNTEKHYGRNFYLYKAQKLIDRIIFIRFCKENFALNNDVVLEALNNKYIKGKYNRIKALFTAMNEGNPEIGITKFNGGLFEADADLDCLNIADEIIDKIVLLYNYDFGSDLDVNILGHIFEQSISDLEYLTGNADKQRKKDGVFYTPTYITEYIVQEAMGGWLNNKKAEIKAKEGSTTWWQEYAKHLQSIKVLDPACGSGAFLVKVFDFLQNQWQEVKKHIKTDYNYQDILLNNIYGVDINPASVGITKLSLWLKTATYRQPLTTLDNNIKIGNSLIDDPNIAGYYSEFEGKIVAEVLQKQGDLLLDQNQLRKDQQDIDSYFKKSLAFKWREEFKQVFEEFIIDCNIFDKLEKSNDNLINLIKNKNLILMAWTQQEIENIKLNKPEYYKKIVDIFDKMEIKIREDINVLPFKLPMRFCPPEALEMYYELAKDGSTPEKSSDARIACLAKTKNCIVITEDKRFQNNLIKYNIKCFNFSDFLKYGKSGFDVVVGNPPYGADIDKDAKYFAKTYPNSTKNHKDSYKIFIDKALQISTSHIGLIVPNTFLYQPRYLDIKDLISKYGLEIINLGENIFENVELPTAILLIKKHQQEQQIADLRMLPRNEIEKVILTRDFTKNILQNNQLTSQLNWQQKQNIKKLEEIMLLKDAGVKHQRVGVGKYNKKSNLRERLYSDKPIINSIPLYTGSDIDRFFIGNPSLFLHKNYKEILQKGEVLYFGKVAINNNPKIVWRQTADKIRASIINGWFANTLQTGIVLNKDIDDYFIISILNSKYYKYLYTQKVLEVGKVFPQVKLAYLKDLPFPIISPQEQQPFIEKAQIMLDLNQQLHELSSKFIKLLSADLAVAKITKKLENWFSLSNQEFFAEVGKQNKQLALNLKSQWLEHFETQKQQALALQNQINQTDNQIDAMVYALYGLSQEEIATIEEG